MGQATKRRDGVTSPPSLSPRGPGCWIVTACQTVRLPIHRTCPALGTSSGHAPLPVCTCPPPRPADGHIGIMSIPGRGSWACPCRNRSATAEGPV